MKTRPILISLTGLAAWRIDGPTVSDAGISPSAEMASGRFSDPDSVAETDAVAVWKSLTAGGGQGFSVHLAEVDLISWASVEDIPRLREELIRPLR